jgi:hypothetical protein
VLVFTTLNITNAKANDPCFDGMCSIEINVTTGKTTITRLSDAEITRRLAIKAEQDRSAAIAKAEADRLAAIAEANKPKPIVVDTSTVIAPTPVKETITATNVAIIETKTVQVATPTVIQTVSPTTIPTNVVVETRTATVDTATVSIISNTTVTPVIANNLSDVIWVIKNQINYIRKEIAKILIRTKGKK